MRECRDLVEQAWSDAAMAAMSHRREHHAPLRASYLHKAALFSPALSTGTAVLCLGSSMDRVALQVALGW